MRRFKFLPLLVLAVSFLFAPVGAEATPPLNPMSDRSMLSLTDAEWDVLGQIQRQCQEVTEGRRTSTAMEIDAPRLLGKNEWTVDDFGIEPVVAMTVYDHVEDQIDLSFKGHIGGMLDPHIHRIMNAIHFIAPSSVDWEDRYGWIQMDTQWNMNKKDGKWFVSIAYTAVDLPVCPEFSSGADYEVSQDKVQRIRDALDRAQEIASRHAGEPAAQRLRSYEDEISNLRSYASVSDRSWTYLPWCFTSVFDGDSSTRTLCEGFAKALTLLVELSGQRDVSVYSVTGYDESPNGTVAHYWCIVRMPDGRNYLTDPTNNLPGTIGEGMLMLAPVSGTVEGGYYARTRKTPMRYTYDDDTMNLYEWDALVLSGEEYVEPVCYTESVEEQPVESPAPSAPAPVAEPQQGDPDPQPVPAPEPVLEEAPIDWSIPVVDNKSTISIDEVEADEVEYPMTPEWVFVSVFACFAIVLAAAFAMLIATLA